MLETFPNLALHATSADEARQSMRSFTKAIIMLGVYATMISGDAVLARPVGSWLDTRQARAEVLSLIDGFQARLLASQTATAALEAWCAEHKMAQVPAIKARIVSGIDAPLTSEQRGRLRIDAQEPVKYRRVELVCGEHVLSEADNWYVPGRLTAAMNGIVETTDTPFGQAVAGLRPHRKTFSVTHLWVPTPPPPAPGLDSATNPATQARPLEIPWHLLEHRALVFTGDNMPFAEVRETYTRNILGVAAP